MKENLKKMCFIFVSLAMFFATFAQDQMQLSIDDLKINKSDANAVITVRFNYLTDMEFLQLLDERDSNAGCTLLKLNFSLTGAKFVTASSGDGSNKQDAGGTNAETGVYLPSFAENKDYKVKITTHRSIITENSLVVELRANGASDETLLGARIDSDSVYFNKDILFQVKVKDWTEEKVVLKFDSGSFDDFSGGSKTPPIKWNTPDVPGSWPSMTATYVENKVPVFVGTIQGPTAVTEGQSYTYKVKARDQGETASGIGKIEWFCNSTKISEQTVADIDNEEEIEFTLNWTPSHDLQNSANSNTFALKAVVYDKEANPASSEVSINVAITNVNRAPKLNGTTLSAITPAQVYVTTGSVTTTITNPVATDADADDNDYLDYLVDWYIGSTIVHTTRMGTLTSNESVILNKTDLVNQALWVKGSTIKACLFVEDLGKVKSVADASKDKAVIILNTLPTGSPLNINKVATVINQSQVVNSSGAGLKITGVAATHAELVSGYTDADTVDKLDPTITGSGLGITNVTTDVSGLTITSKGTVALSGAVGVKVIDFTGTPDYRKLPVGKKATVVVGYRVNDGSASAANNSMDTLTFAITGLNDVPVRVGGASVIPVITGITGSHISDSTSTADIKVPTAATGLFTDVDHGDTITLTYQWQISKEGGAYANIVGATAATLPFNVRDGAKETAGYYAVKCIIGAKDGQNAAATINIESSVVTVGEQTLINVNEQSSVNENETATFTATVVPSGAHSVTSVEWEFSVDGNTWSTTNENIIVSTTNTDENKASTFTFNPNFKVSTKVENIDYDVRLKAVVSSQTIYSSTYNIVVVNVENDPVFNKDVVINPNLIVDKSALPVGGIIVSVPNNVPVAADPDNDGEVLTTYAWLIKKEGKKHSYSPISGATSSTLTKTELETAIEGLGKNLEVCQIKCVITATCGTKSAIKEFEVQIGIYEYTKFVIPYGYYGPNETASLPGTEKSGVGGNQEIWIDGNSVGGKVVNKSTLVKEDTKSFAIDITKKLLHYAPGEYTETIKARKFTMKSANLISPEDAGKIYVKSNKVTFEPALDFNTFEKEPVKFDYTIEVEVNGRLYPYTFIGYIKVLPVNDKPVISWSQETNPVVNGISPIIVATITAGPANELDQAVTPTSVINPTNGFTASAVIDGATAGEKIIKFTPTVAGIATTLTVTAIDDTKYGDKKPLTVKGSIKVISGVANESPSFTLTNEAITAEETAKTAGKAIAGSKLVFANAVKAWTTDAAAVIEAKQKLKFTVVVKSADKAKFTKIPVVALDTKTGHASMSFTVAPNLLGEIATVTVIATDSGIPAAMFEKDVKIFVKALPPTIPTFVISALDAFDEQISTSMISEIKKFKAELNIKGTVASTDVKWFKNIEDSEFATGETVTAPEGLVTGDMITVKVTMTSKDVTPATPVEWKKSFFIGNPEWFPAVNLSTLENTVGPGSYQVTMVQGKVTAKVITVVEDGKSFIKASEYIAGKAKGFQPNQEVRITLIAKWDGKAYKTIVFKEDLKVTPAKTLTFLTTEYGMPTVDTTFEGNISFANTILSCPIDTIDAQGVTYEIWSGVDKFKLKKLQNGTINFSDTMDKYIGDDKNVKTLRTYDLSYNIPATGFYQIRVKAFNPYYIPKTLIFGDVANATTITQVAAPTFTGISNDEFFPAASSIGFTAEDLKSKYTVRFSWPVIDGAEGYILYYNIGAGGKLVKKDMKKLNYFELPTTVASEISWKVVPQYKPDGKKLVENNSGATTGLKFAIVNSTRVANSAPALLNTSAIRSAYNPANKTITLEVTDLSESETWNFYIYNLNETVMKEFENQPAKVTIENVEADDYIIMGSRSIGDETGEWSDEILVK